MDVGRDGKRGGGVGVGLKLGLSPTASLECEKHGRYLGLILISKWDNRLLRPSLTARNQKCFPASTEFAMIDDG
jgi:hypothetical protein